MRIHGIPTSKKPHFDPNLAATSNAEQYWNWDRYAKDPVNSPLFDGSEGSMGGNGAKEEHNGIPIPGAPAPYDMIPPADGGGCVTTGPFKKCVFDTPLPTFRINICNANIIPPSIQHVS